jgi:hypothetical protein
MNSKPHPFVIIALALGAASCSGAPQDDAPAVSLAQSAGGGDLITIESDTMVDGRRARLTLVCERGKPATFQTDLVRAPANPPPLRDVFAQLQAKGGPEVTIELAWMGGANWQARVPHPSQPDSDTDDRNNQQRILPILHAFTRERKLTLRPPDAYTPGGDVVWSPQTMGPHLGRAQECAALDKVPNPGA